MIAETTRAKQHVLHTLLAMLAGTCLLAGCGVRINPGPAPIAVSTGTPAPQATASATEVSLQPSVTPSDTVLGLGTPISDEKFLGLLPVDLSSSSAMTMGQFTLQYPKDGFLKTPARKQIGTAATAQNPFLAIFPELRSMPAPAWLKEGMRVTYHVLSANVAQKEGKDGSGGEGYSQYDLVALEDGAAVSASSLFSVLDGAIMPTMVTRYVGLPGVGEYWINPAVLEDAQRVANDDLAVYHMPYELGNKTYDATRFEYKQDDAEYVWVFDNESGLMLFYRHNLGTDASDYRQMASATLVQQRQLKLPWRPGAKATIPAWAKKGTQLNYDGTYSLLMSDGPTTPLALNVVAKIVERNKRWLDWQLKSTIQYQTPNTAVRAAGMVQPFDAYWLPAEAIKSLKNGQVIDRDPVTGAKITASRGQGVVSLTESNSSFTSVITYDAQTGMLVSAQQDSSAGVGTIRIQLQLTNQ